MCNLAIINATKQLYKGPRGGLYWLDEKGKKHYVNSTSVKNTEVETSDTESTSNSRKDQIYCPFDKKERFLVEGIPCEECWFIEQTKLKGGQYL